MYWLLIKLAVQGAISSAFGKWFLTTKMGVWFQAKLDRFLNYLSYKYDIHITKTDAKWRQDYPLLANRIDSMEKQIEELNRKLGNDHV